MPRQSIGIVAAFAQDLALLGVAKIRQVDFVELKIAAAGMRERLDRVAVREPQIAIELLHLRIDIEAHGPSTAPEMQHRRRRNRHLRHSAGVVAQKAEVIDHRMRRKSDLASNAQSLGLSLDAALERDAMIRAERFNAIQPLQKIEVPHGAAEFAIGGAAQADLRLPRDRTLDSGVLNSA